MSLALAAIALSGSLLLWKSEWLKLIQPGAAQPARVDAAAFGRAAEAAEAAFPGHVRWMIFAGPRFGLHEVALTDGGGAYLEPHAGRVVAHWSKGERVVDVLFDLHHHLFAGEFGTAAAGWIGFAGLLLMLTGAYLWWPARRLFALRVLPRTLKRTHLLAVHRDLGLLVAPVAVVALFTGSALSLPGLTKPAFAALLGGLERIERPPHAAAGVVDWVGVLMAAQSVFPRAEPRLAVWPEPGTPASVRLRQPEEWHANGRTQVLVDPASGDVLTTIDAQAQGRSERLFNALWPVHAARVGRWPWKLILFLSGAGLTALSLYGAESYRRRLFPPRPRQGRSMPQLRGVSGRAPRKRS